jgi:hypothetical protein
MITITKNKLRSVGSLTRMYPEIFKSSGGKLINIKKQTQSKLPFRLEDLIWNQVRQNYIEKFIRKIIKLH